MAVAVKESTTKLKEAGIPALPRELQGTEPPSVVEEAAAKVEEAGYPTFFQGQVTAEEGAWIREQIESGQGLQPDAKGGQTVTLPTGKRIYIPGSTMYEKGFRTPDEYRGVESYGLHEGELVPSGTVTVYDKAGNPMYSFPPGKVPEIGRAHV